MTPQLELPFGETTLVSENTALWTPRDIWVRLSKDTLPQFGEDRRLDFKRGERLDLDDYATYLSAFSNTPDGGLLVFGADSKAKATGCGGMSPRHLNLIENGHLSVCPMARPEFKRFEVSVEGEPEFCIAAFVPYVGRLVETNKGEAWIRYGDSRHRMSEEEKQDFRSTRQELSFEQSPAAYKYPDEFELTILNDFCERLRGENDRLGWSNEEILADRHLGVLARGAFTPSVALVLLAAKDPAKTVPGCRIRIQRFATAEEGSGASYNPIRERYVEGNVVKLIADSAAAIADFIFDVTWLNREGRFVTTKEYPRWAWFECLVNACVHRSYSFAGTEITVKLFPDRMEVESPGGFVPPVNEETIYFTRAARNHHLMDALRHLGYVRMAREGTRRIRESMKEWDLPDPTFKQEAIHGVVVRVTLRNDHETRKRATDRDVAQFFGVDVWRVLQEHEIKIVASAYHNGTIQVSEAQRITGRTWGTSKKDLEKLARRGMLEFVRGEFVRDPKAHYRLSDRAAPLKNLGDVYSSEESKS